MKTKTLFAITNLLIYLFAGISTFYLVVVLFTDAINGFRMALHYLPLYSTLIVPAYSLIALNRIARADSDNRKVVKARIHSIVILTLSATSFVYLFADTFISFGGNFISGGPSKYFPLTFLLLDILFVFIFAYILIVFRRVRTVPEVLPQRNVGRVIADIFKHLYLLFALYWMGTFAFSLYSADLSMIHVLGTIPVYLLLILPSISIFIYNPLKAKCEGRGCKHFDLLYGLASIAKAVLLSAWVFIYLAFEPNFLVEAMTGSFPLDYAMSLNLAPILLALMSIIPPSVFVAHLLLKKRDA